MTCTKYKWNCSFRIHQLTRNLFCSHRRSLYNHGDQTGQRHCRPRTRPAHCAPTSLILVIPLSMVAKGFHFGDFCLYGCLSLAKRTASKSAEKATPTASLKWPSPLWAAGLAALFVCCCFLRIGFSLKAKGRAARVLGLFHWRCRRRPHTHRVRNSSWFFTKGSSGRVEFIQAFGISSRRCARARKERPARPLSSHCTVAACAGCKPSCRPSLGLRNQRTRLFSEGNGLETQVRRAGTCRSGIPPFHPPSVQRQWRRSRRRSKGAHLDCPLKSCRRQMEKKTSDLRLREREREMLNCFSTMMKGWWVGWFANLERLLPKEKRRELLFFLSFFLYTCRRLPLPMCHSVAAHNLLPAWLTAASEKCWIYYFIYCVRLTWPRQKLSLVHHVRACIQYTVYVREPHGCPAASN